MSKTFISGAVCREFESEAPVPEETLDCVACSSKVAKKMAKKL